MINYSTNICSHQVLNPCSNLSRMLTAESVHQEWTKEYQQILDKMTRDIWPQRSHIMAPLTALTSVNVAWKMNPWSSEGFWWNEKSIYRRSFPGLPYFNEVLINCVLMTHRPIALQSRKIEHCSDKQYSYWKSTKLNSRGPEGMQGQQDLIRWIKEQTTWKTYNTSSKYIRWNQGHSWNLSRLNGTETYPMETVIPEEKLQKVVWNQRGKDLRQSSFRLKSY